MTTNIRSEDPASYNVEAIPDTDDQIIRKALGILASRLTEPGDKYECPAASASFLTLKMAELKSESFCIMYLDTRHRLLKFEEVFQGTIDGASVYPREVVRRCLDHNAAAVILSHNHPSGEPEPSRADITITKRLTDVLALIDVQVLDHIVVGGMKTVSFAERGLV